MAGRQQHQIDIVHPSLLAERQHVFDPRARHARLHQTRSALGQNDFLVRRDVIAVGVRNEREAALVPTDRATGRCAGR